MKKIVITVMYTLALMVSLEVPLLAAPISAPPTQEAQTISIDKEPFMPTTRIDLLPEFTMGQSTVVPAPSEGTWLVSLIIPGGAQMLMGKPERGALFLSGMALSIGGMLFFNGNGGGVQTMVNGFLVSALLGIGVYFWNVIDAYSINSAMNKR